VQEKILPLVATYHSVLPNLKNVLMSKWHLIQNQPFLREIFKEPAKLKREVTTTRGHSPRHEPMNRVWHVNILLYWWQNKAEI